MNRRRYWQDRSLVDEIVTILQQDLLIAGSSDTVPGLIAPLTSKGFATLNAIKGRGNKPYLVLVGSKEQAAQFSNALTNEPLNSLIKQYWPGPLTLIVPAKTSVPSWITSSTNTVALRIPNHAGLQTVATKMGGIFSTSANRANQPVPHTIDDLDPAIRNAVTLIVDDRERKKSLPSTILDCTGKQIKMVREGAYTKDELRKYLHKEITHP